MDVSEFLKTGAIRTQRLRPSARGRVSLLTPLLRHISHLASGGPPARPGLSRPVIWEVILVDSEVAHSHRLQFRIAAVCRRPKPFNGKRKLWVPPGLLLGSGSAFSPRLVFTGFKDKGEQRTPAGAL